MSNKKQRDQNRANWRKLMSNTPTIECSNCHEKIAQGHFVPPSFGEEGYFTCEQGYFSEKPEDACGLGYE